MTSIYCCVNQRSCFRFRFYYFSVFVSWISIHDFLLIFGFQKVHQEFHLSTLTRTYYPKKYKSLRFHIYINNTKFKLKNQYYLFFWKYVLIISKMVKKEIIAITGTLGSGKSSASDLVSKKLGYKRFSAGNFFRKIGLDLGISLNEVSKRAEDDPIIDKKTDDEVKKVGEMKQVVIDARTAFHFIPEAFQVYLDLPPEIAKIRILNNLEENTLRKQSEDSSTLEEIYEKIASRLESEKKRYKELYGIDHTNKNNYNLIIDTNKNNLEQVADIIVSEYQKWITN